MEEERRSREKEEEEKREEEKGKEEKEEERENRRRRKGKKREQAYYLQVPPPPYNLSHLYSTVYLAVWSFFLLLGLLPHLVFLCTFLARLTGFYRPGLVLGDVIRIKENRVAYECNRQVRALCVCVCGVYAHAYMCVFTHLNLK